jgi:hypothetical protein
VIEQNTIARCFGTGRFCLYGISQSSGRKPAFAIGANQETE